MMIDGCWIGEVVVDVEKGVSNANANVRDSNYDREDTFDRKEENEWVGE